MYKLIIGNTRVTILSDSIKSDQAAAAARETIAAANRNGKSLSLIEISLDDSENLKVNTTEKSASKTIRKTIKQSMLDGVNSAIKEKLFPSDTFTPKDVWYDSDTGQEWHGDMVNSAKEEVLKMFEEWASSVK